MVAFSIQKFGFCVSNCIVSEKRVHVGSDHVYFFGLGGSGRMAGQSADPATAGSGVGVLDHPGVRKLGVVQSLALEG